MVADDSNRCGIMVWRHHEKAWVQKELSCSMEEKKKQMMEKWLRKRKQQRRDKNRGGYRGRKEEEDDKGELEEREVDERDVRR